MITFVMSLLFNTNDWKITYLISFSVFITEAWVITEGLYMGSSKEIGDIFQEDLKRSEWSEVGDHADIPLIAIGPWGVLAGQNYLAGIYVSVHCI